MNKHNVNNKKVPSDKQAHTNAKRQTFANNLELVIVSFKSKFEFLVVTKKVKDVSLSNENLSE